MADLPENILEILGSFANQKDFQSMGPLAMTLVVTETAKRKEFPLVSQEFLTPMGASVSGLSGAAATKVANQHGVKTSFGPESGRTSRGMPDKMRQFIKLLNSLYALPGFDLHEIQHWWALRAEEFFNTLPISINLDSAISLQTVVHLLLEKAVDRQRRAPGTTYVGAVLQHLVGAKFSTMDFGNEIEHHGASAADMQTARAGDFLIQDTVIHVTTSPAEPLIKKCCENLTTDLRPIIITTLDGARGAENAARMEGIADRIEIIEIGQFISTNIYERSQFHSDNRRTETEKIIRKYNELIDLYENNPSLKIELD